MIYIFVPFFSVTDCDQNYMQMINLKKLPKPPRSKKVAIVCLPGVLHNVITPLWVLMHLPSCLSLISHK